MKAAQRILSVVLTLILSIAILPIPAAADAAEPVIMDFSSKEALNKNAALYLHDGMTEGKFGFVTLPDGTGALKLDYLDYTNFSEYRCMPKFLGANRIGSEHKYVRVTYMSEDAIPATVTLRNNAINRAVTLVGNTSVSQGKFVHSNAVNIDQHDLLTRLANGIHCTLEYNTDSQTGSFYIKEIGFFVSEAQAYGYYGDSKAAEDVSFSAMTFGPSGNGSTLAGSNFGVYEINSETSTLDISYAEATNAIAYKYMAKIKFNAKKDTDPANRYMRVYYAADIDGSCAMRIYNDKVPSETVEIESEVTDTNGEYVLSHTVYIPDDMNARFSCTGNYGSPTHSSLVFDYKGDDAVFSIKAVYFFPSKESADAFVISDKLHKVTVNGNDIGLYRVVISRDAPDKIHEAADAFISQIKKLTGKTLPIVTDDTDASEYEILIGESKRPESTAMLAEINADGKGFSRYFARIYNNKLIISATLAPNVVSSVKTFTETYLFGGATIIPDSINITDKYSYVLASDTLKYFSDWDSDGENAVFECGDLSVFLEKNGADNFVYDNRGLTADINEKAMTYLHFYAKNGSITASFTPNMLLKYADFGVSLRTSSDDAWLRGGYDAEGGRWYIAARQGSDFFPVYLAEAPASVKCGESYEITLTANGNSASLTVNGEILLTAYNDKHLTPGFSAIFCEAAHITVSAANVKLSYRDTAQFTDISYTVLPYDKYIEGGQVYVMKDGSLIYQHHSGTTYSSYDDGRTWVESPLWTESSTYVNIIRLNNGDFMKAVMRTQNGKNYFCSLTSSDEGKTWTEGGNIAPHPYPGTTANATNMNDKLFQSPTTDRIFYVQNYETTTNPYMGKYLVFGIIYYSDDNGKTWQESETATFEMEGNENEARFGESKILECADGTLRLYNSWNEYGCIVYSESRDNGVTWGPIVKMPEFISATSSMQFNRDPYAENDSTYYMVWVNSKEIDGNFPMTRARLTVARTTDGKNWEVLGDVWRWESVYSSAGGLLNQAVDPFVAVTPDRVIVGAGISEGLSEAGAGDHQYHHAQRQHIWSIGKDDLTGLIRNLYSFTDVNTSHSYYGAVKYAYDNGLFKGTSDTAFSPDATMTRAMFVTVLGRLSGVDVSAYQKTAFTDVKEGEWYAPYVEWAASSGIVKGIGDSVFGVNGAVTAEQAATLIYRYAKSIGCDIPSFNDEIDLTGVSDWARDGYSYAMTVGLAKGYDGEFAPTSPASRALVAVMFANFAELLK